LPSYHLTNEIMTRYARRLASKNVRFLYGYPSSLELFASFLLDSGLPTSSMQAVFTTSELLSPGARRTIETAFGCPVFDLYGCNDGGLYSFECEHHNGFHQAMESCIVEVVDDEGLPLPEGEMGRIVTTHLANRCHPFLRYVTGDVGALDSTPCACGRGLVRIVHIQGRERDFVLTPGGRMVHGAFFNHFEPFYKSEWLERFQVHQPSQDRLIVRLIVQKQPTEQEQSEMIAQLKRGLGEMEITIDIVDELVLTETGKFRVVTSDLN
jgi:phenylacetate-CoA ligase